MNKKDLEFIMTFAETRGLMQESFEEVFNRVCNWMSYAQDYYDCDCDTVIDIFMGEYKINGTI